MFNDFEKLKSQLGELVPVINSFKSEAVQLKIVEIIFMSNKSVESTFSTKQGKSIDTSVTVKKHTTKTRTEETDKSNNVKTKRKKGPAALINDLIEEDFFTKKRSIKEMIDHCDVNKAISIKSKDFASALTKFTREGKLKREKNENGQYEYIA